MQKINDTISENYRVVKDNFLAIPEVSNVKNKILVDFKKAFKYIMIHELVNIYGEGILGGLSKVQAHFWIKHNLRQPTTGYYNVVKIKENDILMLLDISYTFDKINFTGNKQELNFWFTILVNGTKTYTVCAKQFISLYKQSNIICLLG